jgi:hypothetical protein
MSAPVNAWNMGRASAFSLPRALQIGYIHYTSYHYKWCSSAKLLIVCNSKDQNIIVKPDADVITIWGKFFLKSIGMDNIVGRFCGPVSATLACQVTPLPSHLDIDGLSDRIFRDIGSVVLKVQNMILSLPIFAHISKNFVFTLLPCRTEHASLLPPSMDM